MTLPARSPDAADGSQPGARPDGIVARLDGVGLRYGKTLALDAIALEIPASRMVA